MTKRAIFTRVDDKINVHLIVANKKACT